MKHKGTIQAHTLEELVAYRTDTGAADAYAVALEHPITAYSAGLKIRFKAANANTGSSTLAVDGLAAKTIKKNVSSNLSANDILANQIITVIYDGTNFQILGIGGTAATGITVGVTTISSGTDTRVPFNDGGVYGEDAGLVYNKTTDILTVNGGIVVNGIASQATVFNENGVDADLRIEGDTDTNLFFVDASTDRIGIGLNNPSKKLEVLGDIKASKALTNSDIPAWPTSQGYIINSGMVYSGNISQTNYHYSMAGTIGWTSATSISLYSSAGVFADITFFGVSGVVHSGQPSAALVAHPYVLNSTIDAISGITIHTEVSNSTITDMYGVYIANSLSSATITNYYPFYQAGGAGTNIFSSYTKFSQGIIINDGGFDSDTIIEGDTDTALVHVDASADRVGIGVAAPAAKLDINGNLKIGTVTQDDTETKILMWNSTDKIVEYRDVSSLSVSTALNTITAAVATNSINNLDYQQAWNWNSLSGNNGLQIKANSTLAASNSQTLFYVELQGVNDNSSQTTRAVRILNNHSGTSSTNVALWIEASSGSNNYAIIVPSGLGFVGFGTNAPTALLHVVTPVTTGQGVIVTADSLSSGSGVKISAATTAADSNSQKLLEVLLSGANSINTQTTYAGYFNNTHSGTGSSNIGVEMRASGGATLNAGFRSILGSGGTYVIGGDISVDGVSATNIYGLRITCGADGGTLVGLVIQDFSGAPANKYGILVTAGVNSGFNVAAPKARIHTTSFGGKYRLVTSNNYTVDDDDFTLDVDNDANNWTIVFPNAASYPDRILIVKRKDGTSSGTLTIDPSTGQIQSMEDGSFNNTVGINTWQSGGNGCAAGPGGAWQSDGTNWVLLYTIGSTTAC